MSVPGFVRAISPNILQLPPFRIQIKKEKIHQEGVLFTLFQNYGLQYNSLGHHFGGDIVC